MRRFYPAIAFLSALFAASVCNADQLQIAVSSDATIIEDPQGELANGSGPGLFAGKTGQRSNGIRRALLRFDLEGALPKTAQVSSVELRLYLTPSNASPAGVSLHRVLQPWKEGPSSSSGGSGDDAQAGDVTWLHTRYKTELWRRAGGHFVPAPSATTVVEDDGFYTWSGNRMLADLRAWQRSKNTNFGWLVAGDESRRHSVKRFAAKEEQDESLRPVLIIEYSVP